MNPVIDSLVKQVAEKLNLPEEEVYNAVRHQFKYTYEQLPKCKSVEVTGFGYFSLRRRTIHNRIKKHQEFVDIFQGKLEKMEEGSSEYTSTKKKLDYNLGEIEYLKTKIDAGL